MTPAALPADTGKRKRRPTKEKKDETS
jgi:hypothetical protein